MVLIAFEASCAAIIITLFVAGVVTLLNVPDSVFADFAPNKILKRLKLFKRALFMSLLKVEKMSLFAGCGKLLLLLPLLLLSLSFLLS
jgi:hypothetical protein